MIKISQTYFEAIKRESEAPLISVITVFQWAGIQTTLTRIFVDIFKGSPILVFDV